MHSADGQEPCKGADAPVVFLMGPTASGKTGLAEMLCQHYPFDVISVDSSAVYRQMDIGSAKPDAAFLQRVPHRLINIRDPGEVYSAADFVHDARREISAIVSNGRIPLLVGGSMLYFKALLQGLADMPGADAQVRAEIAALADAEGWHAVHAQLEAVDPESAARIHPNDPQRLQRALEVYRISGRSMTELQNEQGAAQALPYKALQMAITPASRALLHERIALRFDQMLEQGFVAEVESLVQEDAVAASPAMKAVGYRQVAQYLRGEIDYEQMRERGVIASRQLAKRQLTWLRGWPELNYLLPDQEDYETGLMEPKNGQNRSISQQSRDLVDHYVMNK